MRIRLEEREKSKSLKSANTPHFIVPTPQSWRKCLICIAYIFSKPTSAAQRKAGWPNGKALLSGYGYWQRLRVRGKDKRFSPSSRGIVLTLYSVPSWSIVSMQYPFAHKQLLFCMTFSRVRRCSPLSRGPLSTVMFKIKACNNSRRQQKTNARCLTVLSVLATALSEY